MCNIDDNTADTDCDLFVRDTDEENILNTWRGLKRNSLIVICESENEEEIDIVMDRTAKL